MSLTTNAIIAVPLALAGAAVATWQIATGWSTGATVGLFLGTAFAYWLMWLVILAVLTGEKKR